MAGTGKQESQQARNGAERVRGGERIAIWCNEADELDLGGPQGQGSRGSSARGGCGEEDKGGEKASSEEGRRACGEADERARQDIGRARGRGGR